MNIYDKKDPRQPRGQPERTFLTSYSNGLLNIIFIRPQDSTARSRAHGKEDQSSRGLLEACSHAHMFTTCLITCLSYQFTGRDMPLQKLSGVAIFVSLQECGFFRI